MNIQDKFDAEYSQLLAKYPDLETYSWRDRCVILYREGRMSGIEETFDKWALARIIPCVDDTSEEAQKWDEAYTPSVIVRDA